MRTLLVIGLLSTVMASSAWPRCQTPEHRQFDFWIGNWDAYDLSDTTTAVARVQVTSILDGCALREVYVQKDGLNGESFTLWDASRGRWHQSWVTNRGALLQLEGRLEGVRMVLTAPEWKPDGSSTLLRGLWWRDGANVRHKAERSMDGGRTWTAVWDMVFRPHRIRSPDTARSPSGGALR